MAAFLRSSAGIDVIFSVFSGEYLSLVTILFSASKDSGSRYFSMHCLSYRPSSKMTCMKLFSQGTSVPLFCLK